MYCFVEVAGSRALIPRVLRALSARISTFGEYSMSFDEVGDSQICVVRTWDKNTLLEACVHAAPARQRVPDFEIAALARLVNISPDSRLPLGIRLGGQSHVATCHQRQQGRWTTICLLSQIYF